MKLLSARNLSAVDFENTMVLDKDFRLSSTISNCFWVEGVKCCAVETLQVISKQQLKVKVRILDCICNGFSTMWMKNNAKYKLVLWRYCKAFAKSNNEFIFKSTVSSFGILSSRICM